jgi:hypothetical protein
MKKIDKKSKEISKNKKFEFLYVHYIAELI